MKRPGKIQYVLLKNWDKYIEKNEFRIIELINVIKVLICRTKWLGKHIYSCPDCDYEMEVPHSCKSRFCSVCGTIATENWVSERLVTLLDCGYHHIVVTLPPVFRYMIKMYRVEILNLFSKCVAESIFQWSKEKGFEPGMVSFHHSFGSNLQFHPHYHFLVTAGGITKDGRWKNHYSKMPGNVLMEIFKAKFSAKLKSFLFTKLKEKNKENKKHNNKIYKAIHQTKTAFNQHWQYYTEAITRSGINTMLYCVRYVKKMIISEKRILHYDKLNQTVTFLNGDKKILVYDVMRFIKCIVQHIPEKNFKLVKYYGFYANKSQKKYLIARKYWKPFSHDRQRINWRIRQFCRSKVDPMKCIQCHKRLILKSIVYPPKSIYRIKLKEVYPVYGIDILTQTKLDYG